MDDLYTDKRFSHVGKDPRFRSMPKKDRKVKIDKRFQGMFKDERFKLKYSVDKKGRRVNKTSEEDLKRFYELSDDDDDDVGSSNSDNEKVDVEKSPVQKKSSKRQKDQVKKTQPVSKDKKEKKKISKKSLDKKKAKSVKPSPIASDSEEELAEDHLKGGQPEDSDEDSEESGVGSGPDLARGEGNVSSSDDEDEDWEPDKGVVLEHNWGEGDKDVPEASELGRRLAVCNMDWDRIKARDLYVLFSSFKPTGGIITSVTIYPSDFGEKMMRQENSSGPGQLIQSPEAEGGADTRGEDGSEYNMEQLRQYQLNRLKYFYAVVDCDSIATASHIYDDCDGLEYETSSAKLDLRFIPDEMEFDQKPHSVCKEIPNTATFEPSTFLTTALCQSKVELTWDETDRDRIAVTRKKIKPEDIGDDDFKAYLASSSEDEAESEVDEDEGSGSEREDEESKIEKYKSLLRDIEVLEKQKEDREVEMEITWEPGLREATEQMVKKGGKKEQSVWEQYLEKKKEKKQKKREEKLKAESKQSVEEGPNEAAFSDDELPEGVDVDDQYFTGEMTPGKKESSVKKKKGKKPKLKLTASEQEALDQKKAELSLLMMEEGETDSRQHFSLPKLLKQDKTKSKRKRKGNSQEETADKDTFQFKVDDSRFQALYNSHHYNLDPSAPEFKRTKVMDTIIEEKLKRRKRSKRNEKDSNSIIFSKTSESDLASVPNSQNEELSSKPRMKDPSISALVNSVKTKTKNFHKKKSNA